MVYEFITPSDPITFKADSDKIAFFCAVLLGNGQAGCDNVETGESVGSLLLFCSDAMAVVEKKLECKLDDFHKGRIEEISTAFKSFSYGSVADRITYDSAIDAITNPDKLEAFKKKHEDENRTSMSKWVNSAWEYAKYFETKKE